MNAGSSVLKYQTYDIDIGPINMRSMLYERDLHACTIFESPLHNGRPVAIAAGGSKSKTAEVLDYTVAGAFWEISKLLFLLSLRYEKLGTIKIAKYFNLCNENIGLSDS